jgi:hypothetical protein
MKKDQVLEDVKQEMAEVIKSKPVLDLKKSQMILSKLDSETRTPTQLREIEKQNLLERKEGYIEFASYTEKKAFTPSRIYSPVKRGGTWLGIKWPISREMRESEKLFVDPENMDSELSWLEVQPGTKLNLAEEKDRLILKWLVENPGIALSFREGISDHNKQYYIRDRHEEIASRSRKISLKREALNAVELLENSELPRIARLMLGAGTFNAYDPMELRSQLEEAVDKRPQDFLRILTDKLKDEKSDFNSLLDSGIIYHDMRKSEFKFNDYIIGNSPEAVISFIQRGRDEKNPATASEQAMYRSMMARLAGNMSY